MRARSRRGANAVEFALTLPAFVAVLFGIIEFSWMFNQRALVLGAMRTGCRTGAIQHPEAGASPEDAATDAITAGLAARGFRCDERCTVTVIAQGVSPFETITCRVAYDYDGLTGLMPRPDALIAESVQTLEVQR